MANALFDPGREGFLDGTVQWNATPTHKVLLVRAYTYNAAHKFVSDVTTAGGTIAATSSALTTKTATSGAAGADTAVFSVVASGAAIPAMIVIQSSAVGGGADVAATAQRVIAFIDTASGTLPVTPNGGEIDVAWDAGANRIFKL